MLGTSYRYIKYFEDSIEMTVITAGDSSCMDQLSRCLESICERTQDFTDSAYISHDHRQNIIILCERAKLELGHLLLKYNNAEQKELAGADKVSN